MVGKLLKKIVRGWMRIRDIQHGFVHATSCLANLIELFEEVTKVTNEGRQWLTSTWILVMRLIKSSIVRLIQEIDTHMINSDLESELVY